MFFFVILFSMLPPPPVYMGRPFPASNGDGMYNRCYSDPPRAQSPVVWQNQQYSRWDEQQFKVPFPVQSATVIFIGFLILNNYYFSGTRHFNEQWHLWRLWRSHSRGSEANPWHSWQFQPVDLRVDSKSSKFLLWFSFVNLQHCQWVFHRKFLQISSKTIILSSVQPTRKRVPSNVAVHLQCTELKASMGISGADRYFTSHH